MSITFNPAASPNKPADLTAALDEISRTLPGLQGGLGGCGLTVLGRASADELTATVRTAYDPAARGAVSRLTAAPTGTDLRRWLDWETAGPVMAEEHVDRYVHDSGASVSWAWHEAPRQNVHSDVLARLLAPGPYPKRVTQIYRPFAAGPPPAWSSPRSTPRTSAPPATRQRNATSPRVTRPTGNARCRPPARRPPAPVSG